MLTILSQKNRIWTRLITFTVVTVLVCQNMIWADTSVDKLAATSRFSKYLKSVIEKEQKEVTDMQITQDSMYFAMVSKELHKAVVDRKEKDVSNIISAHLNDNIEFLTQKVEEIHIDKYKFYYLEASFYGVKRFVLFYPQGYPNSVLKKIGVEDNNDEYYENLLSGVWICSETFNVMEANGGEFEITQKHIGGKGITEADMSAIFKSAQQNRKEALSKEEKKLASQMIELMSEDKEPYIAGELNRIGMDINNVGLDCLRKVIGAIARGETEIKEVRYNGQTYTVRIIPVKGSLKIPSHAITRTTENIIEVAIAEGHLDALPHELIETLLLTRPENRSPGEDTRKIRERAIHTKMVLLEPLFDPYLSPTERVIDGCVKGRLKRELTLRPKKQLTNLINETEDAIRDIEEKETMGVLKNISSGDVSAQLAKDLAKNIAVYAKKVRDLRTQTIGIQQLGCEELDIVYASLIDQGITEPILVFGKLVAMVKHGRREDVVIPLSKICVYFINQGITEPLNIIKGLVVEPVHGIVDDIFFRVLGEVYIALINQGREVSYSFLEDTVDTHLVRDEAIEVLGRIYIALINQGKDVSISVLEKMLSHRDTDKRRAAFRTLTHVYAALIRNGRDVSLSKIEWIFNDRDYNTRTIIIEFRHICEAMAQKGKDIPHRYLQELLNLYLKYYSTSWRYPYSDQDVIDGFITIFTALAKNGRGIPFNILEERLHVGESDKQAKLLNLIANIYIALITEGYEENVSLKVVEDNLHTPHSCTVLGLVYKALLLKGKDISLFLLENKLSDEDPYMCEYAAKKLKTLYTILIEQNKDIPFSMLTEKLEEQKGKNGYASRAIIELIRDTCVAMIRKGKDVPLSIFTDRLDAPEPFISMNVISSLGIISAALAEEGKDVSSALALLEDKSNHPQIFMRVLAIKAVLVVYMALIKRGKEVSLSSLEAKLNDDYMRMAGMVNMNALLSLYEAIFIREITQGKGRALTDMEEKIMSFAPAGSSDGKGVYEIDIIRSKLHIYEALLKIGVNIPLSKIEALLQELEKTRDEDILGTLSNIFIMFINKGEEVDLSFFENQLNLWTDKDMHREEVVELEIKILTKLYLAMASQGKLVSFEAKPLKNKLSDRSEFVRNAAREAIHFYYRSLLSEEGIFAECYKLSLKWQKLGLPFYEEILEEYLTAPSEDIFINNLCQKGEILIREGFNFDNYLELISVFMALKKYDIVSEFEDFLPTIETLKRNKDFFNSLFVRRRFLDPALISSGQFDPYNYLHLMTGYKMLIEKAEVHKISRIPDFGQYLTMVQDYAIHGESGTISSGITDEKERAELVYLAWEAYEIKKQLIDPVTARARELNRTVVVVENLSYGGVALSPIKKLLQAEGIQVWSTKVGSSESHENPDIIDLNLFSEEQLQYLVREEPIVIVIDGSYSLDPEKMGGLHRQNPRYPDARQGYANYFARLTKTLCPDADVEDSFGLKYPLGEIDGRKEGEYREAHRHLERKISSISRGGNMPYQMFYWYAGDYDLRISENRQERELPVQVNLKRQGNLKTAIRGPTLIFVESAIEDQKVQAGIRRLAKGQRHNPAFYDDQNHFRTFHFCITRFGPQIDNTYANFAQTSYQSIRSISEGTKEEEAITSRYDVILLDLDGTLADVRIPIPQEIAQALIRRLRENVKIGIITAQSIEELHTNLIQPLRQEMIRQGVGFQLLENLYLFSSEAAFGYKIGLDGILMQPFYAHDFETNEEKTQVNRIIDEAIEGTRIEKVDRGPVIMLHGIERGTRTRLIDVIERELTISGIQMLVKKRGKHTLEIRKANISKRLAVDWMMARFNPAPSRVLVVADGLFEGGADESMIVLGARNISVGEKAGRAAEHSLIEGWRGTLSILCSADRNTDFVHRPRIRRSPSYAPPAALLSLPVGDLGQKHDPAVLSIISEITDYRNWTLLKRLGSKAEGIIKELEEQGILINLFSKSGTGQNSPLVFRQSNNLYIREDLEEFLDGSEEGRLFVLAELYHDILGHDPRVAGKAQDTAEEFFAFMVGELKVLLGFEFPDELTIDSIQDALRNTLSNENIDRLVSIRQMVVSRIRDGEETEADNILGAIQRMRRKPGHSAKKLIEMIAESYGFKLKNGQINKIFSSIIKCRQTVVLLRRQKSAIEGFVRGAKNENIKGKNIILAWDDSVGIAANYENLLTELELRFSAGNVRFVRAEGGKLRERIKIEKDKLQGNAEVILITNNEKLKLKENRYTVVVDDRQMKEGKKYLPILEILTFAMNVVYDKDNFNEINRLYKEITDVELTPEQYRSIISAKSILLTLPPIIAIDIDQLGEVYKLSAALLVAA